MFKTFSMISPIARPPSQLQGQHFVERSIWNLYKVVNGENLLNLGWAIVE
jgi:hypothetical protein